MANQYVNKVVLSNGSTLIDISADTVTAADLLYNKTAHDKSGAPITGTCTYDADTSDATASASEILATKTAYVNGVKVTGEMTNNGEITGTISTKAQQFTIPQGFHDGSGKVSISSTEQAKIIGANIKAGVEILGETGTYTGEAIKAQTKNATPTFASQTILPDSTYDYLSQVTVAAIPVTYTDNAAGGRTCTIG